MISALMCLAALLSCSREDAPPVEDGGRDGDEAVYHEMIVLGQQLEDPYSVEHVKAALARLYPTKAGRVDVEATHIYARFLPEDDEQLEELIGQGLELSDHPFDYQILREGDYYHDPAVDGERITWQYAVVGKDFVFPERCS